MSADDPRRAAGSGVGPREAQLRARLGPRLAPMVVLAGVALLIVVGLVVTVVGPQDAPAHAPQTKTFLGTAVTDPNAPPGGIAVAIPKATVPATTTTAAGSSGTGALPAGVTVFDPFDRPSGSTSVGSAPGGAAWQIASGSWTVQGGVLAASGPGTVTVALPSGATSFGGVARALKAGDGVLMRWSDAGDNLALVASPAFGGWQFRATVGGVVVFRHSVRLSSTSPGVSVVLGVVGHDVTVQVNGRVRDHFTLPADALPSGTRAGFVQQSTDPATGWTSALVGS